MRIISTAKELLAYRNELNATVVFIPTMGALHEGQLYLVRESKKQNDITVVSIFLNPTQFNNSNDLNSYPEKTEEDLKQLKDLAVDICFLPTFDEVYPDDFKYSVSERSFSNTLCGAHRPGHLDGVLTIHIRIHLLRLVACQVLQQFQCVISVLGVFGHCHT